MATITITIPDNQLDDVAAAAGATLPDPRTGAPADVVDAALRSYLASLYAQHIQRSAAANDPSAAAAQAAEAAARQALAEAKEARDAAQSAANDTALANAALWT